MDIDFDASSDSDVTIECTVDNDTPVECDTPFTTNSLSEGLHTVEVTAVDEELESASDSVSFVVDTIPPDVWINSPAADTWFDTSNVTLGFTAIDDNLDVVECSSNGFDFTACTDGYEFTGLSDGQHTLYVRAFDLAGYSASASVVVNVDTIFPDVEITSPSEGEWIEISDLSVEFSATDSNSLDVECGVDGATPSDCASPLELIGLADGSHEIAVRAIDPAGNETSVTRQFNVDATPPDVSIDSPSPGDWLTSGDVTLNFTVDGDNTEAVECSSNGSDYSPCVDGHEFFGLTDGQHTLYVRVLDAAGRSASASVLVNVDSTAPSVSITSPAPDAFLNTTSVDVEFEATDTNLVTTECSVDGGSFSACSSPLELTGLSEAEHTVVVRATDAAGLETTASRSFTIETDAPIVTILSPTSEQYFASTSVSVSFTAVDSNLHQVRCSIDGGSFQPCSSPRNYTSLSQGSHSVSVRATDKSGNETTASVTFYVDTVNPSVAISAPTAAQSIASTTVNVAFTATDASPLTIECRLDGGDYESCTSPWGLSGLSEGGHTVDVRGTDAAGNTVTASRTFTVDTIAPLAPTVTRTSPTPDPASSTSQTITYSGAEGGGTFECKLDSASFAPCTSSPVTLTGLSQGSHTYSVRQIDAAGNEGSVASVTWTVDTVAPLAPTVTRTSPTASPTNSTSQTISFSAAEGGGTLECRLDGASYAVCPTSPTTVSGLTDGSHTYYVRQTDAAGNIGAVGSVTWTVDTIAPLAPTVTRTSPSANPTNSTSQQISYSGAEGGGSFECKLDAEEFAACTGSPVTLTGLSDGSHTYYVRQTDAAGNVGAVGSVTWTVDTIAPLAPTVTRTSPTADPASSTSQTIAYSGAEGGGTFECKLDSASFAPCASSPVTLTGLSQGSHTYSVRQIDAAGNEGSVASVTWTVDTVAPLAPTVTRTSPTANPTNSTSQTISFSAAEGGGTLECRLDGASYAACPTSPTTLIDLADGSHTYYVRQTDAAGNVGAVGSVTWTVDTIAPLAPTVTRTSPTADPASSTSQTITYSGAEGGGTFECKLDSASFAACTGSPVTLTGLSQGSHTYTVRQTDAAGNVGAEGSVTWTVDTIKPNAPTVTRTSPTANPTSSTSQTIEFSAAEPGGTLQCRLDSASFTTCPSSPVTLTGLTNGSRTYQVRQIDAAGNTSDAGFVTWTVDTSAPATPTVTRTSPTASPTNSTSQQITYSGAEGGGTYQCKLDSAEYAACPPSPLTLTGLLDGSHTYYVRQIDSAGNVGAEGSVTWTVDTIAPLAPTVTRTSPTTDPTNSTTQVITYSGAEGGGTFQCKLDDGDFVSCPASPVTLTGLTHGSHTATVRQVDAAGNIGSSTSVTWTVDTVAPLAPTVTRTNPTGTPTNSTSQVISYSGAEAGGTFQCKLDSASYATCPSSPLTLTGLSEGSHTYYVRQIDAAGNVGTAGSVTWTVDTIAPLAPTVTRTSPTANPASSNSQTITYTGAEGGGTFQCKLYSASYATCPSSPLTLTGLSEGSHTYYVRQIDAAGNVGAEGSVTWTVDTIAPLAPTVTRTSPTANPASSTSQTITYSGAEGGGTFQCKLDSASFSSCTGSPVTLTGLSQGSHTYYVRQIDAAGNVGAEGSVSWTVDTIAPLAPTATRTSPTANPTNSTNQQVSFSGAEGGGTFQCKLDSGDFAVCGSSPVNLNSLADGLHTFTVRHIDAAGNISNTTSTSWTIDTVPPSAPTVSRTTPTVEFTTETSQTITYTGAEGGGTFQCRLDNGSFSNCPVSPVTLSSLADGARSYTVRQVDAAGNAGATKSVSWTVDTTNPQVSIGSPANGQTLFTDNAAVTFSGVDATALTYECRRDAGSFTPCGAPFTLSGLDDGAYTAQIRATDRAGNQSTASVQFNVDLTSVDRSEQFGTAKPKGKLPLRATKRSRLIFRDEFNGTSLNRRKWVNQRGTLKYPYSSAYNIDKEAATYSRQNVSIENGRAVLTLKRKPEGEDPNHPYSSGMIHSGNHFSFQHGYVEARVLVPKCVGCWPAFWMLNAPVDEEWPPEIDIFEFFNTNKDKRPKVNFHWKAGQSKKQWGSKKYGDPKRSYVGRWHTYGLHWTAKKAQVFVDGKPGPVFKLSRNLPKKPNYLIFNLALQKGFNPTGERRMMIDYVRVWK